MVVATKERRSWAAVAGDWCVARRTSGATWPLYVRWSMLPVNVKSSGMSIGLSVNVMATVEFFARAIVERSRTMAFSKFGPGHIFFRVLGTSRGTFSNQISKESTRAIAHSIYDNHDCRYQPHKPRPCTAVAREAAARVLVARVLAKATICERVALWRSSDANSGGASAARPRGCWRRRR